MTKEESIAYLKSKHIEKPEPVGELPISNHDIEDEMSVSDGFGEHKRRVSKDHLTSDEIAV